MSNEKDEQSRLDKFSFIIGIIIILGLIHLNGGIDEIFKKTGTNGEVINVTSEWEYFENANGTLTLTKYLGSEVNVNVPSVFRDKIVTRLEGVENTDTWEWSGVFADGNAAGFVETVTLPSSITEIGNFTFANCENLTEVTIPNSVVTIGKWAFFNCQSLTEISIPDSVTTVGKGVFKGCSGLTNIPLGNSITSIGPQIFEGCSGLTNVTIPNNITSIGYRAFADCSELMSVTIPDSVISVGVSAFSGCSKLAVAYILGSPTISVSTFPTSTSGSITSIPNPSGTYYDTDYTRWYTNANRTTEQVSWSMARSSTAGTTILWGSP